MNLSKSIIDLKDIRDVVATFQEQLAGINYRVQRPNLNDGNKIDVINGLGHMQNQISSIMGALLSIEQSLVVTSERFQQAAHLLALADAGDTTRVDITG